PELGALEARGQDELAFGALAGAEARVDGLDAVVDGVPDRMDRRAPELRVALRVEADAVVGDLDDDAGLLEARRDLPRLLGGLTEAARDRLEAELAEHAPELVARRPVGDRALELEELDVGELEGSGALAEEPRDRAGDLRPALANARGLVAPRRRAVLD